MSVVVLTPDEVGLLRLLDQVGEFGLEAANAAMTVGASYDEVTRLIKFGMLVRAVVEGPPAYAVLRITPVGRQTLLHLPKVR